MGTQLRRAAITVVTGLLAACGSQPGVSQPESMLSPLVRPAPHVLDVEYAGCLLSSAAPATCGLPPRHAVLKLWVDSTERPLIELDGTAVSERAELVEIDEGWRVVLQLPATARDLRVSTANASWQLNLTAAPPTPTLDEIQRALPDETDPRRSAVLGPQLARLVEALPRTSGFERASLLRLGSILSWDLGKSEDAVVYGRLAITAALDNQDATTAVTVAQNLAHFLSSDPVETEWLLELQRLYVAQTQDASLRARWHYAKGYHAFQEGEFGEALREFEHSERLARRLGLTYEELLAASIRVSLLALLGREDDRRTATTRVLALASTGGGSNACKDAVALLGTVWSLLLARASSGNEEDPGRILQRVLADFEPGGGCAVGDNADWVRLEQYGRMYSAVHALQREDFKELGQRLAWFEARAVAPELATWIAYLRAELQFAEGRPGNALATLNSVGRDRADPLLSWQTTILRGRALELTGKRGPALEAYLEAERLLDVVQSSVAIDQGREGLATEMHAGASRAIALLIADGHPERASEVARLSRTRALRPVGRAARLMLLSPESRRLYHQHLGRYRELADNLALELTAMWQLPSDERAEVARRHSGLREEMRTVLAQAYELLTHEAHPEPVRLPPVSENATLLLYHPSDVGWFGFAVTAGGSTASKLQEISSLDDRTETAHALLDPFAKQIAAATEIHILAMGDLVDVPFEWLPVDGVPLLAAHPIAYSLDLGSPPDAGWGSNALVVSSPSARASNAAGALLGARREATTATSALQRAGFIVEVLAQDRATQSEVATRLQTSDWFHYAGHGVSEGVLGWDSALPLAGEARLTVRDVLALEHAPRAVVLSACETGSTHSSTAAGGMHLAAAFVMAGARFVIASHGDVDDDSAAAFSSALYERASELHSETGASLLRRALLDAGSGNENQTPDFRVWVP